MTTVIARRRDLPDRNDCHSAHFATRWHQPTVAVVTVHGELDAVNAQAFADYAVHYADRIDRLVLDLSGVNFFGTAGFSSLHTVNVRCAGHDVTWALVPSRAVSRLLRICDPDGTLPGCPTVASALAAVRGETPPPLLQLVTKPR
jgi:anti-anti-sigma factor